MGFGIGTMGADDGYPGIETASTLTPAQQEAADLSIQIAGLDDAAQNAEDREQLGKASAIRAKIKPLEDRLRALQVQS